MNIILQMYGMIANESKVDCSNFIRSCIFKRSYYFFILLEYKYTETFDITPEVQAAYDDHGYIIVR